MSEAPTIIVVDSGSTSPAWLLDLGGQNTRITPTHSPLELKRLLIDSPFSLVVISTQLSATKILDFLTAVKEASTTQLIPVIFSLDLAAHHASFPLTSWAGKFAIIHSQTSQSEWQAILRRLLTK
ncbi:MAG TPA: hypothetical protein DEP87_04070 [Candidatus Pacebacteria bacterium]|nr:hypothetical protein [Candidatus Paceibacterota bacterium]